MTTYETKLGTAKITSGRQLVKGVWGVQGQLADGRKVFLSFEGRKDLAAAFPAPSHLTDDAPAGRRVETIYDKMERSDSIH
jgi:hypothetical protein